MALADPNHHDDTTAAAPAASNALIELRDVTLKLGGVDIYDRISFSVGRRELVCILGPSGCGKSTLLRLIGDLIGPTEGEITIAGRPAAEAWDKIAYVFQSPRLVPWRTALRNVMLGRELRFGGKADDAGRERAESLLRMVGLERDIHKFPAALSGGERQRVSIARAIAVEPEIILMDEPLSALDINTRQRLRDEIQRIRQLTGKTIVFVTHDIDDALTLADRVLLLSGKPSRVVDTVRIDEPHPRRPEHAARLQQIRNRLRRQFDDMQSNEDRQCGG